MKAEKEDVRTCLYDAHSEWKDSKLWRIEWGFLRCRLWVLAEMIGNERDGRYPSICILQLNGAFQSLLTTTTSSWIEISQELDHLISDIGEFLYC